MNDKPPKHSDMKNAILNRTPEGTHIGDGVGGLTVDRGTLQAILF